MSRSRSRLHLAAASVFGVLGLAACSGGAGSSPAPTSSGSVTWDAASVAPPEGRVIGAGTVLDGAGDAELCLGPIAESYPPQCAGIPVDGWTWDGVDGSETGGDTTWGSYAVYGTYDGERYTITDPPILLALYDPIRPDDPAGGVDGTSSDTALAAAQEELSESLGRDALTLWVERGYVWVQVVWDDGSLQDAVDATYGDGVVIVTSALREID
ncbi:hypothetical protein [Microbacterium sp. 3J1]|uniref:hypothetical protein n=1 Tax=Microbacterium sp. 3J1 TaxID=861269 RepID=UPI000B250E6C|nr:hypothetical protein [Microbacterium sp. 3J1]